MDSRLSTPVFAARGTMAARASLKDIDAEEFDPGDELVIAGVRVQTFSTSHDVTNPCGMAFSLDSANDRSAGADGADTIGFVTDTGVLGSDAASLLYGSRILALESNHDVSMLRCGPTHASYRIESSPITATFRTSKPPTPRQN